MGVDRLPKCFIGSTLHRESSRLACSSSALPGQRVPRSAWSRPSRQLPPCRGRECARPGDSRCTAAARQNATPANCGQAEPSTSGHPRASGIVQRQRMLLVTWNLYYWLAAGPQGLKPRFYEASTARLEAVPSREAIFAFAVSGAVLKPGLVETRSSATAYCCGFGAGFGGAFAAGLAAFGFAFSTPFGTRCGSPSHLAGCSKSLASGGSRLTLL